MVNCPTSIIQTPIIFAPLPILDVLGQFASICSDNLQVKHWALIFYNCVQLDTFFRVIIKDKLLSCLLPICYILVDPPPLTCCAMETPKISLAPSIVSHFARSPRKSRQLNSANNSHEALGRFRRRIIDTLDSGKFKPVAPTFPGRVLISRVRSYSRSSLRIVSLTTVLTVVSLTDKENNFAAKLVRKLGLIHSFLPNLG